jgi:hypothetical protein
VSIKLGLIGAPRSGKSLIGEFLSSSKGYKQFAFADQVKEEFFSLSKFSEKDFEWAKRYNRDLEQEIRSSLWKYSDSRKKENGNLYFIEPIVKKIKEYGGDAVVTDIRTEEEIEELRKIGVKFVVISRLDEREDFITGTRISYKLIENIVKFNNWFDKVEDLYKNFEIFFTEKFLNC